MTEAIKGSSAASGEPLSDEELERLTIRSGLDEELWFGKYTPKGYEDALPKLRKFADLVLATATQGAPRADLAVPDDVWEALQRLIENAASLGPSSQEDAMVVARWRGRFVQAREGAAELVAAQGAPTPAQPEADKQRLDWLDQNIFHREMADDWDRRMHSEQSMWVLFSPKGAQGSARNIIDAAAGIQPTPAKEKDHG